MALFRHRGGRRTKAWPVGLAVAFVLGTVLSAFAFGGGPLGALAGGAHTAYGATIGSGSGTARAFSSGALMRATPQWTKTLPPRSATEKQVEANGLNLRQQLKAAPIGPRANVKPADPRTMSPQLSTPKYSVQHPPASNTKPQAAPGGPLADSDIEVPLYSSPSACGACGFASVMETSVGNNGKYLFETGNWFATVSTDNGSSWSAIDPYAYFAGLGHGSFCCDQQVLYEPSRNRFFWEALTYGGLGNAANGLWFVSMASDFSSACAIWVNGPTFGQATGTLLDFPQIEYSANFLYATWNSYDGGGSWLNTQLARIDLSAFASCSSFSGLYITRTDNFTYALGQGATDTMYWASNWYTSGPGSGTSARFFFWGEHSGSYTFQDKSITPYNFVGGESCASQDGSITDWCGARIDPRRGTLFRSRAGFKGFGAPMLGYLFNAGPTSGFGSCDPFPFVQGVYFLLSNMTYKQVEYYYNCGFAVVYPSAAAPTQRGYIGIEAAYGGGIGFGGGAVNYYPSDVAIILDTDAANAPGTDWFDFGLGNATAWGDYDTVRPYNPDQLHWIAGDWWMLGSSAIPEFIIFGKVRDHASYLRWSAV